MKKRLGLVVSIFLGGTVMGFSQSQETFTLASLPFVDSSVGKQPNFPFDWTGQARPMGAVLGKAPEIITHSGPPPHASGPGLRFDTKKWFYIYTDRGAAPNHYIPSGWMGDYENLTLDTDSHENPADGKTCIKIGYLPKETPGAGWAGMYWQQPINNWGDKTGGYDLKGMKRLTFWARGERGGEVINEFTIGGIQGEHPDSDTVSLGPVVLTSDWKQYEMDLSGADLSKISGGFAWATSLDSNPNGIVFYLDEIRFER